MKKFQKRLNAVEFAHACRQVIGVINLRKLTNRQFENSKQLSKTAYLGRKRSVFFGKPIRQIEKASSLLLIPTHFYQFLLIATHWSVLRVHDKAGFSKNLIIPYHTASFFIKPYHRIMNKNLNPEILKSLPACLPLVTRNVGMAKNSFHDAFW